MHIVVNGWVLAEAPQSPAAFHLLEVAGELSRLAPEIRVTLVVPAAFEVSLPGVQVHALPVPLTPWGRLRFEQRHLPRLARALGADLLLALEPAAPLVAPVPVAAPRQDLRVTPASSALDRLRRAMGLAGAQAAAEVGFADLLAPGPQGLPPFVASGFRPTMDPQDHARLERLGLETQAFVLCHGALARDIPLLLAAWTWVDGSLGDQVPLAFLGLEASLAEEVLERARDLDVHESVRVLPPLALEDLPALYRGAAALFHPGHTAGGQELRWALATGTPVVGVESQATAAVLGEAAYLTPPDARALGAALLSVLVNPEEVARPLREKGLLRAAAYHGEAPRQALLERLRRAVGLAREREEAAR